MSKSPRGRNRSREQRLREIVALLRSGVIRVEDLAVAVDVSESTVRRDLASLEAQGYIDRTYGGARPSTPYRETRLGERMRIEVAAKAWIGATAAQWVEDGATIFVDAGSTCAQLIEHLPDRRDLTVITRGLEIGLMLADRPIKAIVIGGEVSSTSHGPTGAVTLFGLERFSCDLAFLGCDAVHPSRGVGEPTIEEAATKEMAAHHAGRTVVLAHAAKLAPGAVPAWAHLPKGWTLVTDGSDPRRLEPFHQEGVTVMNPA